MARPKRVDGRPTEPVEMQTDMRVNCSDKTTVMPQLLLTLVRHHIRRLDSNGGFCRPQK